jgi:hypothetical protein
MTLTDGVDLPLIASPGEACYYEEAWFGISELGPSTTFTRHRTVPFSMPVPSWNSDIATFNRSARNRTATRPGDDSCNAPPMSSQTYMHNTYESIRLCGMSGIGAVIEQTPAHSSLMSVENWIGAWSDKICKSTAREG